MNIPNIYEWKNYKYLVLLPIFLIVVSAFFIPQIPRGIDLKGGLLVTVHSDEAVDVNAVKAALAGVSSELQVRTFDNALGKGVEIELPTDEALASAETKVAELHDLYDDLVQAQISAGGNTSQAVTDLEAKVFGKSNEVFTTLGVPAQAANGEASEVVKKVDDEFLKARSAYRDKVVTAVASVVSVKSSTSKEVGSSLSKFFFSKTQEILILAFLLTAAIIFIRFRSLISSFAVVFGAFADVAITAGVMGALGIPLSLASLMALLMLIGFALDTEILLAVRIVQRKEGNAAKRAFETMGTAFMMNLTTVAAFGVLLILGWLLQINTYYVFGLVAVTGGIVDFIVTGFGNTVLILWHAEKNGHKTGE